MFKSGQKSNKCQELTHAAHKTVRAVALFQAIFSADVTSREDRRTPRLGRAQEFSRTGTFRSTSPIKVERNRGFRGRADMPRVIRGRGDSRSVFAQ
jgi:hypothetical protein